jgi:hypothetical protein
MPFEYSIVPIAPSQTMGRFSIFSRKGSRIPRLVYHDEPRGTKRL